MERTKVQWTRENCLANDFCKTHRQGQTRLGLTCALTRSVRAPIRGVKNPNHPPQTSFIALIKEQSAWRGRPHQWGGRTRNTRGEGTAHVGERMLSIARGPRFNPRFPIYSPAQPASRMALRTKCLGYGAVFVQLHCPLGGAPGSRSVGVLPLRGVDETPRSARTNDRMLRAPNQSVSRAPLPPKSLERSPPAPLPASDGCCSLGAPWLEAWKQDLLMTDPQRVQRVERGGRGKFHQISGEKGSNGPSQNQVLGGEIVSPVSQRTLLRTPSQEELFSGSGRVYTLFPAGDAVPSGQSSVPYGVGPPDAMGQAEPSLHLGGQDHTWPRPAHHQRHRRPGASITSLVLGTACAACPLTAPKLHFPVISQAVREIRGVSRWVWGSSLGWESEAGVAVAKGRGDVLPWWWPRPPPRLYSSEHSGVFLKSPSREGAGIGREHPSSGSAPFEVRVALSWQKLDMVPPCTSYLQGPWPMPSPLEPQPLQLCPTKASPQQAGLCTGPPGQSVGPGCFLQRTAKARCKRLFPRETGVPGKLERFLLLSNCTRSRRPRMSRQASFWCDKHLWPMRKTASKYRPRSRPLTGGLGAAVGVHLLRTVLPSSLRLADGFAPGSCPSSHSILGWWETRHPRQVLTNAVNTDAWPTAALSWPDSGSPLAFPPYWASGSDFSVYPRPQPIPPPEGDGANVVMGPPSVAEPPPVGAGRLSGSPGSPPHQGRLVCGPRSIPRPQLHRQLTLRKCCHRRVSVHLGGGKAARASRENEAPAASGRPGSQSRFPFSPGCSLRVGGAEFSSPFQGGGGQGTGNQSANRVQRSSSSSSPEPGPVVGAAWPPGTSLHRVLTLCTAELLKAAISLQPRAAVLTPPHVNKSSSITTMWGRKEKPDVPGRGSVRAAAFKHLVRRSVHPFALKVFECGALPPASPTCSTRVPSASPLRCLPGCGSQSLRSPCHLLCFGCTRLKHEESGVSCVTWRLWDICFGENSGLKSQLAGTWPLSGLGFTSDPQVGLHQTRWPWSRRPCPVHRPIGPSVVVEKTRKSWLHFAPSGRDPFLQDFLMTCLCPVAWRHVTPFINSSALALPTRQEPSIRRPLPRKKACPRRWLEGSSPSCTRSACWPWARGSRFVSFGVTAVPAWPTRCHHRDMHVNPLELGKRGSQRDTRIPTSLLTPEVPVALWRPTASLAVAGVADTQLLRGQYMLVGTAGKVIRSHCLETVLRRICRPSSGSARKRAGIDYSCLPQEQGHFLWLESEKVYPSRGLGDRHSCLLPASPNRALHSQPWTEGNCLVHTPKPIDRSPQETHGAQKLDLGPEATCFCRLRLRAPGQSPLVTLTRENELFIPYLPHVLLAYVSTPQTLFISTGCQCPLVLQMCPHVGLLHPLVTQVVLPWDTCGQDAVLGLREPSVVTQRDRQTCTWMPVAQGRKGNPAAGEFTTLGSLVQQAWKVGPRLLGRARGAARQQHTALEPDLAPGAGGRVRRLRGFPRSFFRARRAGRSWSQAVGFAAWSHELLSTPGGVS
ncbi:hypothetical protein Cadr_000017566 [Camelus dromedarius]|uniref:Uncharacterized protein n=1 Tax=Camelus dromedarius TaxID=9838 RepID=A0A5N4DH06_CAMDR|nr:hypothetical protein Cadr_000017566 [Camelus dromedarius]